MISSEKTLVNFLVFDNFSFQKDSVNTIASQKTGATPPFFKIDVITFTETNYDPGVKVKSTVKLKG